MSGPAAAFVEVAQLLTRWSEALPIAFDPCANHVPDRTWSRKAAVIKEPGRAGLRLPRHIPGSHSRRAPSLALSAGRGAYVDHDRGPLRRRRSGRRLVDDRAVARRVAYGPRDLDDREACRLEI